MKKILILGAGRSSSHLIEYLLDLCDEKNDISVFVADINLETINDKTKGRGKALIINSNNPNEISDLVKGSFVVVSMLPPHKHIEVAHACLIHNAHLVTASYVSTEMQDLHQEALRKNLCFMNEIGLDPGIDHLSAMQIIDDLIAKGANITSFKSWCGGLVAPRCDNNPWNYKISWNPKNVVLAGQSSATYLLNGCIKNIPYVRMFSDIWNVETDKNQYYDGYANRDSLHYKNIYGLHNIDTLLRGTLRAKGFCKAWNILVQLGLTNDTLMLDCNNLTIKQWSLSFIPKHFKGENLIDYIKSNFEIDDDILNKIKFLDLDSSDTIEMKHATSADILLGIIVKKWKLETNDTDKIVMKHEFEYTIDNKQFSLESLLYVEGENPIKTAMSKTVGMPAALFVEMLLNDEVQVYGVNIPIQTKVYKPLLAKLKQHGIQFIETIKETHHV